MLWDVDSTRARGPIDKIVSTVRRAVVDGTVVATVVGPIALRLPAVRLAVGGALIVSQPRRRGGTYE